MSKLRKRDEQIRMAKPMLPDDQGTCSTNCSAESAATILVQGTVMFSTSHQATSMVWYGMVFLLRFRTSYLLDYAGNAV